jgi:hypothetical protein
MRHRPTGGFLVVLAAALVGCDDLRAPTAPSALLPQSRPAAHVGRLSGEFTLTLTTDAACDSLPIELRTRTYGATWIANTYWHSPGTYYDIWISGPTFLQDFNSSERFYAAVTDDDANFGLGSLQGQPAFVEQLSASAYFAIGGAAAAALSSSASSFAASMDGYVEYCVMKSPADVPVQGRLYDCATDKVLTRVRCESNKHRLNWDRHASTSSAGRSGRCRNSGACGRTRYVFRPA